MRLAFVVVAVALFGAGLVTLNRFSSSVQLDGTRQSDSRVTAAVRSALEARLDLEARQVDVETGSGVVRLTGNVTSEASRREIVRVALETAGVRGVADELSIGASPASLGSGDESIPVTVRAGLRGETGFPAADLDDRTAQGVARLNEFVASQASEASEASQREAERVTSVVDEPLADATAQPIGRED